MCLPLIRLSVVISALLSSGHESMRFSECSEFEHPAIAIDCEVLLAEEFLQESNHDACSFHFVAASIFVAASMNLWMSRLPPCLT
jgi:hypothetical protein